MGHRLRHLVLAVLGGLAIVGGLTAAAVWGETARLVTGSTAAAPMGWTVPLASVFVIAGVAWLLLSQDGGGRSGMNDRSVECPACGRSVMADWRLCPYCGSLLDPNGREPRPAGR